jgi:ABC-2 type transport system ATP-binding protein
MARDLAIEAAGLEKSYAMVQVLGGLDLQVERGSIFALLGPNGAGKTTTVRILATLVRADAGHARVAGFDVARERSEVRRRISLTGQQTAVDNLQTGEENLVMLGRLSGLPSGEARRRAGELIEQFDLGEAGRKQVALYSGGMRRRLDLAASLVGRPAVIFLDEPTTGLDPRSRRTTWQIIRNLAGSGVTIFLTTQYLEEADQLADRIALIDGGKLVAEGSPTELKTRFAEQRLDLTLVDALAFEEVDRRLGWRAINREASRWTIGVATDGSAAQVRALLDELDPRRELVATFAVHDATLDDVFLALTGGTAGQPEKETANV